MADVINFPAVPANDAGGEPGSSTLILAVVPAGAPPGTGLYEPELPNRFAAQIWEEMEGDHSCALLLLSEIQTEIGALRLRQLERRLLPPRGGPATEPEAA
jgi:hypothetical protein